MIRGLRRRLSNERALAHIVPALDRFGITRVAQQTALDTIGISCYAAIRPNSRTLAVNQGKGPDDRSAQLSAIMEAVEFSVAETPGSTITTASIDDLTSAGRRCFVPTQLLPADFVVDPRAPISWVDGQCLVSGDPVLVPIDSAALAPSAIERLPFSQSSIGLGSGFAFEEALVHALCEAIERDSYSLWSLRTATSCAATELDLSDVEDPELLRCIEKVTRAGFRLEVHDMMSDLGLPSMLALLWTEDARSYFDVASGMCARPSAPRAVQGAIEEAAQTRISNIAGARDDILPSDYDSPLPSWIGSLIGSSPQQHRSLPRSMGDDAFAAVPERLGGQLVAVRLTSPEDRIAVVKVLSDSLEDRLSNTHWRPGRRAIKAMIGP